MSSEASSASEMNRRWLLQGQLFPPSFRIALIDRPLLAHLETHGAGRKLVSMFAPAGFGKSSLLSQWGLGLAERGNMVAWITLSPLDADPAQLLTHLVMSLAEAGQDVGALRALADRAFADTPVASAAVSLAGLLAADSRPLFIIVDDAHHAPRAALDQVLGPLIKAGLPHVRLALAGRCRPALSVADLRSRGEVLEFGSEALGFGEDEIAALFPDQTADQRAALAARTGGWPVALQLARLWLAARPDGAARIEDFTGRTAEMAEYLTEQVFADLPEALCEALELTAPLDAVCEDLVTLLTGSATIWSDLTGHHALAPFITPVDQSGIWFRYHPLFIDFLRNRLHLRAPARERQGHERASHWFEGRALPREAAYHAMAAGDVPRAAALIEDAGAWELVVFGGAVTMRTLLSAVPTELLADFPRLALCRAFVEAKNGAVPEARRQLEAVERAIAADPAMFPAGAPIIRDLLVTRHLIAIYGDFPVSPELEITPEDIAMLAPDDVEARSVLTVAATIHRLRAGEMAEAHAACDRYIREMRAMESVLGANYGYIHLGFVWFHLGNRREAEATFREAIELGEENFGLDDGMRAVADVGLAVTLAARGDVAGATAIFDRSIPLVEAHDGWLDVFAEAFGAAISTALVAGDFARARDLIDRGMVIALRRGLPRLDGVMAAHRGRLAMMTGRLQDARAFIDWRKGAWREDASLWRECHAHGVAAAELEIMCGNPAAARAILADLAEAAASGSRGHDGRRIAFLDAIAQFDAGRQEDAGAAALAMLEPALREEDTGFLVESGTLGLPLLHHLRQWTQDKVASALVRQAIARAVRRLATAGQGTSEKGLGLLSSRELEVLIELVQGSPNKVIARALQMSENTVKFHLKSIFQKLQVNHRTEAVRVAREQGLDGSSYSPEF